jgi:hypothetical protein
MSFAASASIPGEDPLENYSPEDVQHIWLPTHRSLCDLASQRFEEVEEADVINDRARRLPVCAACEVVMGMLDRRLKALHSSGNGSSPADIGDAVALLRGTRWGFVSSDLR